MGVNWALAQKPNISMNYINKKYSFKSLQQQERWIIMWIIIHGHLCRGLHIFRKGKSHLKFQSGNDKLLKPQKSCIFLHFRNVLLQHSDQSLAPVMYGALRIPSVVPYGQRPNSCYTRLWCNRSGCSRWCSCRNFGGSGDPCKSFQSLGG